MPKERVQNLMSELHELFGTAEPSAQQVKLMESLEYHIHNPAEAPPDDPTLFETLELMVEQMQEEHPRTSAVLRELADALRNMGV